MRRGEPTFAFMALMHGPNSAISRPPMSAQPVPESAGTRPPPPSRRFVVITGKGGVGKTTVAAALGVALASQGKRVLIAMCGAHERLSAMLRTPPIGHELSEIRERLWATQIAPARAMREYGELVIKVRPVTRLVFENQYTQGFFRAVPGLYEWAMLGKAWFHSTEERDDGSPRFDTVIFDAPSTGHALHMLRIPQVIVAVSPPGVLRRDAERAWQSFRDPSRTGVVVVTWPADMVVTETIELVNALRADLELPIVRLVINGTLPILFSAPEREALLRQSDLLQLGLHGDVPSPGDMALAAAARRASREQLQERSLERLSGALDVPCSLLPLLLERAGEREGIEKLATEL